MWPRTVCVVLSGTGADGSLGIKAVKAAGGVVIAELPEEADFDGMPRSAILTGAVDKVLPIKAMPEEIIALAIQGRAADAVVPEAPAADAGLFGIVALLRDVTVHDFTLYKTGTLERRISRRLAMAGIAPEDTLKYLALLRNDRAELDLLAKDLLINVTSFFRDPAVFDFLAREIIPDLVRNHPPDQALRLWVAGCSTGEETYSLAMLFFEAISAAKLNVKLQIFATEVDADAVAAGRAGLYPTSIAKEVSRARLARFFRKEEGGYRVSQEMRAAVVFTVQDLLADPPFSRIDMISCHNLLIYLLPEAQAKVISLFHFSLRQDGYLLLGNAEALGDTSGRCELASKAAHLFRHVARSRPGELGFSPNTSDGVRVSMRAGGSQPPSRHIAIADLCRRLVLENYAPAAVLINQRLESLFSLGPLDRYLRVPAGHPTLDVVAMARPALRTRLRAAIQQAQESDTRVTAHGGRMTNGSTTTASGIDVHPVTHDGEKLLLVCFIDTPQLAEQKPAKTPAAETGNVADLERELDATRAELHAAISNLERSGEEQAVINEEALSVNEEYQSTNEELLTSKEELQSVNEELTALNTQLQETLEWQRTTSNDLQNVLYSTDIATLFLDTRLNIRFFTPATKSLFSVIPTDIGRPLADLKSLAADADLLDDARAVMASRVPVEREIVANSGQWYTRRILPYRLQDNGVEGVVITFADITERRQVAQSLEAARQEAENANLAKSRFLASASHDLRQPLQALTLLQGLLAKTVEGEAAKRLVALLDPTLSAMTTMLNTLLDINQIDAGTVQPHVTDMCIGPLLNRLRDEFGVVASAYGLGLRVVPCDHTIRTDPRLLEQMLRNLLSNALKYTKRGRVLMGCRHRAGMLSIEVWDTGIGMPASELASIFEEYRQLDNPARERSRGLGLGLSIVKRLGDLLGHAVRVRSQSGTGSVFAIEVARPAAEQPGDVESAPSKSGAPDVPAERGGRKAAILVIEDDPDLRDLLERLLAEEGYCPTMAANGEEALALVARGKVRPELVLADYNLPLSMNGLELAARLRARLNQSLPVIILTGDVSTTALRDIAAHDCVRMIKPVRPGELTDLIQQMLPAAAPANPLGAPPAAAGPPLIYVVDDDPGIRAAIRRMLEHGGHVVQDYASCEDFLASFRPGREGCLVVDAYLPGMHGLELLQTLHESGQVLPSIMITGESDVAMAVQAMKAGAMDLLEKPVDGADLLEGVEHALESARDTGMALARQQSAVEHLTSLTARQCQIMTMILAGQPSKNIAADLGISQRTVENHRASIMHKTGASSLPALARLAVTAEWQELAQA
jgi:two-component system CheB/CheR fusion protein